MLPARALISLASFFALAVHACDPLTATCPADPALGESIRFDFLSASDRFEVTSAASAIAYDATKGMELSINKRFDNPSLRSDFYIMFGRVQFELKAAPGTVFLQSDDLDEIDFEWFGGDAYEVSTNWFTKGNTATYDRGIMAQISNPQADYHTYAYEWTLESLSWIIDGVTVRTLYPDNPQGYPKTPMRVFAGIWAGGDPSNAIGTIEWAGDETDYSQVPFTMYWF
ncbi:glycoside hydrolase family 16 protein [Babjeviella inositovora NRRL Y-12698]|uniref:Glycoside hydrolase family 16 protein n=1 Tax=Babjeviella inositovora NRRL Y-12698 TaxID=984486 RepID=A0A1E3QSU1_9ASCO|nr:glycoside hydrolase family 16 protein [Babjeviella inositovora NRRL Y-12698]ODQ80751.1 glycoside hydrolase family 16 protein [Babjeviella inositovora NRRL Y-12698]